MDRVQRDALLARYREHSARLETLASRRATASDPAEREPPAAPEAREHGLAPTAREIEVLELVSQGLGNREIAERLRVSEETVKSHVRHILSKLEADTRTQAVAIALREAMID